MIYIFMHESGHHISGFYDEKASLSKKRAVEARADDWAAKTLASINERPMLGATLALGYIARMEGFRKALADAAKDDPNFIQIDSPHPVPKNRVAWTYDRYCAASVLENNPSKQGPCDLMKKMIEDL